MSTVLVVEDDRLLSKSIISVLKKAGNQVISAVDGHQALLAVEQNKFDLILLDIMLPGDLDGYAILNQLKSYPNTVNIPVIMLTNLGQTQEMQRALDLGAVDYIIKANTDLSQILEVANKHLGKNLI